MKKRSILLTLALAVALVTGCQMGDKKSELKTDYNRIYVSREHIVSNSLVYTSEVADVPYTQEELRVFAEAEVAAYNEARGAGRGTQNTEGTRLPVSLTSSSLEGQTGKLVFEYGSADDFVAFSFDTGDDTHTVTRLVTGSVSQAAADGVLAGGSFMKLDNTAVALEEITKQPELCVIVFDGAATFQTEGSILYVSEDAALTDEFTARFEEGTHYIIFK